MLVECLVAGVAQAIEEENNIDNARHFELARRVAGIRGEASTSKSPVSHEDIKEVTMVPSCRSICADRALTRMSTVSGYCKNRRWCC